MTPRRILFVSLALLVALIGWFAYDWQPDRQIRKKTERLLAAIEDRDWERVRDTLTDDYTDGWDLDRDRFIQIASEGMRQFFYLTVEPSDWRITKEPGDPPTAEVTVTLNFEGNGTGLAKLALNRLTELREPFVFQWRKESWTPWSWQLSSTAQPELTLSPGWSY